MKPTLWQRACVLFINTVARPMDWAIERYWSRFDAFDVDLPGDDE